MSSPRGMLFFDLGWTLEDEKPAQEDRASRTLEFARTLTSPPDHHLSVAQFLEFQEDGARAMVPHVYDYALTQSGLSHQDAAVVKAEVAWNGDLLSLYPGVAAMLETLSRSYTLGIIANQSPGSPRRLIRRGIHTYFKHIFTSAEIGMEKPDARLFRHALNECGFPPSETWMIGDRVDNDIRPARRQGWRTARVLQGYNRFQPTDGDRDQPDITVHRITDIGEAIGEHQS